MYSCWEKGYQTTKVFLYRLSCDYDHVIPHVCLCIPSCGGNLLLNTGPTHDGRIAPIMEERLRQIGEVWWMITTYTLNTDLP